MLQQTKVRRVVPRWHAFLERFPTPAACASAGAGEVVRAWASADVAAAAGWPGQDTRARRATVGLVADGLADLGDGTLRLP
jgi:A/G-specific adenine glycosylase